MMPTQVPVWKKWLMVALVVSFVVMALAVRALKRSARSWEPSQPPTPVTRPAR